MVRAALYVCRLACACTKAVRVPCLFMLRVLRATLCSTGEPLTDPTTGAQIPPGVDIQVLLHALHMHPQHWGADAAVWNPERWLPGAPNGAQQADVFFPFLDGLRRCAGMYLAELEFAVLLYM
ncbi:MAG: cytochrome P450, partial [Methanobacteriota archaeon]